MSHVSSNKYLLLSSSLLVDRVYLYSSLVKDLRSSGEVSIWAASAAGDKHGDSWSRVDADVETLPVVGPFREFPHNILRRLNEFVWDYRFPLTSRASMMRHVRRGQQSAAIRSLRLPAWMLAKARAENIVEAGLDRLLIRYPRSNEAEQRLAALMPSVMLTTGPFQFEQPGIFAAAAKLKIPTLCYIPSWDNVTTKNRMVFNYDGYVVWTEKIKQQLHDVYPYTRDKAVYVIGAPQYDLFLDQRFYQSREEFCRSQGLNPGRPIILYAVGSPNFLREHHGAVELAKRISAGRLGDVQMVIRPHPIHDNAELNTMFGDFAPRVRLQQTVNAGLGVSERTQNEVETAEWINSFRHADVVINLSSTVTIDAALFDRPVINLDFDPSPEKTQQQLINEINHEWEHFKPVAESGAVWLVSSFDELCDAAQTYLADPARHRRERKLITEYVCGYTDGKCAARMAAAIEDFARCSQVARVRVSAERVQPLKASA